MMIRTCPITFPTCVAPAFEMAQLGTGRNREKQGHTARLRDRDGEEMAGAAKGRYGEGKKRRGERTRARRARERESERGGEEQRGSVDEDSVFKGKHQVERDADE